MNSRSRPKKPRGFSFIILSVGFGISACKLSDSVCDLLFPTFPPVIILSNGVPLIIAALHLISGCFVRARARTHARNHPLLMAAAEKSHLLPAAVPESFDSEWVSKS